MPYVERFQRGHVRHKRQMQRLPVTLLRHDGVDEIADIHLLVISRLQALSRTFWTVVVMFLVAVAVSIAQIGFNTARYVDRIPTPER